MKRDFLQSWFQFNLEQLKRHVEAIESLLEREADSVRQSAELRAQEIEDESMQQDFYEAHSDEIFELEDLFPQMQRRANIMAIMSFAEIELNKLCDDVATHRNQSFRVNELNGRGIERARNYLMKAGNVKSPWQTPEWNDLKKAADIRNAIVHNDSRIQADETKSYILSSPHLILNRETNCVSLQREFASHVLSQFGSLYDLIVRDLDAGV